MSTDNVVIGLGSPHGDDQIGWLLVDRLNEESVAASLWTVNDAIDIVEHLEDVARLVIVDACRSGGQPGEITRLDWSDPRISSRHGHSTHRISLIDSLQLAQHLGRLPVQVIVYGIEVKQCVPQTEICTAVMSALPELARRVVAELSVEGQNREDVISSLGKSDA